MATDQDIIALQQQNAMLKAQQENEDRLRSVKPADYNYTSISNPNGTLQDQFQLNPNNLDIFSQLKTQATGAGPSTWANMQLQNQKNAQATAAQNATAQGAGAQANARNNLAMHGGLGSGSRLALARSGMQGDLANQQNISRQGMEQQGSIMAQDAQTKQGLLQNLGVQEGNAAQYNIQNALAQKQAEEAAKQQKYGQQMQSWGSERQAQATEKSKGK